MPYDRDRLRSNWNGMQDPESASAEAVELCEDILQEKLNPRANFGLLKTAIEAAWDGPEGNLRIAHEALLKTEIFFYDAERRFPLGTPQQLRLRFQSQVLIARSWHRKSNPKQAVLIALGLIKTLEDLVGGRKALLEVVSRPTQNAVTEAVVETLGIYIAALRRVQSHPTQGFRRGVDKDIYKVGFDLLIAYLGPDLSPAVIYPGTDAAAAQWFYRLVRDEQAPDALVHALYELDKLSRPAEKRSEATAHARDAEYALRFGEQQVAECEKDLLLETLERLGMKRHLETIQGQNYFATQ